jgi:hypothetical protein
VSGIELLLVVMLVIIVVVMLIRDAHTQNILELQRQTIDEIMRTNTAQSEHLKAHDEAIQMLRGRAFLTNVHITPLDAEGKPSGPAIPWGPQKGEALRGGSISGDPHGAGRGSDDVAPH